jgi:hypothetical protein
MKNILHLFSGYNTISTAAHNMNIQVVSVDIVQYRNAPITTHIVDIFDFNFKQYLPDHFDFILVSFPCTTFSKASGNFHFKNHVPVTADALHSIEMIKHVKIILEYYKAHYLIENPTSALFTNKYFLDTFDVSNLNHIRTHQYLYGHKLHKQTDLLTTSNVLWLDNRIYRVNGKYSKIKIDYIQLRERQSFPLDFCNRILNYIQLTCDLETNNFKKEKM